MNGIFSKFTFRFLTFIIMINLLFIQLLIMVINEFILIVLVVSAICTQFWLLPLIIVTLELITTVTVTIVNGIFPQPWLDVIITIARNDLLFMIYFMHQVSNYLFNMNIQTVVYINMSLEITILLIYFIAMHTSLFAVLILILIFHIGICLGKVINELQLNVLLLKQLIFQRFQMARVVDINFKLILHVSVFILVMVLQLILSILFNDNENQFDVIFYVVTIPNTTAFNGLFVSIYMFNLIVNENDITVYHYIYDMEYQFKVVYFNDSGLVCNSSTSLDKIIFLQQVIVCFNYGIYHHGLQQHLVHNYYNY